MRDQIKYEIRPAGWQVASDGTPWWGEVPYANGIPLSAPLSRRACEIQIEYDRREVHKYWTSGNAPYDRECLIGCKICDDDYEPEGWETSHYTFN